MVRLVVRDPKDPSVLWVFHVDVTGGPGCAGCEGDGSDWCIRLEDALRCDGCASLAAGLVGPHVPSDGIWWTKEVDKDG